MKEEAEVDLTAVNSLETLLNLLSTKLNLSEHNKDNKETRVRIEGAGK